jgi:serine/threonine protein kinase
MTIPCDAWLFHVSCALATVVDDPNRVEAQIAALCCAVAPLQLTGNSALWSALELAWTHEHDRVQGLHSTARSRLRRLLAMCGKPRRPLCVSDDEDLALALTWFLRCRPRDVDLLSLTVAVEHDALRNVRAVVRELGTDAAVALLTQLPLVAHLARSAAMIRLLLSVGAVGVGLASAVNAHGCTALHAWCLEAHTSAALRSSSEESASLVGSNQIAPFEDDDLQLMIGCTADLLAPHDWRTLVHQTAVVDERRLSALQICVQRRLWCSAMQLSQRGADALATSDDALSALEMTAAQLADDASVLDVWRTLLKPHTRILSARDIAALPRAPIGSGGFAVVSRVDFCGKACALKELRLSELRASRAAAWLVKSFISEVTLQLCFSRDSAFVPLYGVCVDDASCMSIVMAFMPNGCLSDRLYSACAVPLTVNAIGARLGRAVAILHARHVLHRDLTTRNVLLDADWSPKIADFGISRFISDAGSATMTQIGNVRWAAPEITRSERYSSAADIYQLALVVFECLTRTVPFDALTQTQAAVAAARGDRPTLPAGAAAWLPLLGRAWHADPRQRPTAAMFAAECDALPHTAVPNATFSTPSHTVTEEVSY